MKIVLRASNNGSYQYVQSTGSANDINDVEWTQDVNNALVFDMNYTKDGCFTCKPAFPTGFNSSKMIAVNEVEEEVIVKSTKKIVRVLQ